MQWHTYFWPISKPATTLAIQYPDAFYIDVLAEALEIALLSGYFDHREVRDVLCPEQPTLFHIPLGEEAL